MRDNMERTKIKAVIFDMDGLMFDTERIEACAWHQISEEMGFEITEENLRQLRGRNLEGGRKLFQEWYGGRVSYDEGRKRRAAYVNRYIEEHGTPVKEGLLELFLYLREKGYQKAIATSSSRETAIWYFEKAGIAFDFEISVCGGEVEQGKPAPDIFLEAVRRLGLRGEECLALEDSFNGVRSAAAAGCQVIMVPDMQQPDEEIRGLCLEICRNLSEAKQYLDEEQNSCCLKP